MGGIHQQPVSGMQSSGVARITEMSMNLRKQHAKTPDMTTRRLLVIPNDFQKSKQPPGGAQNGAMAILDDVYRV